MTAPARRQLGSIFACYAGAGVYWGALVASFPALQAISGLTDGPFGLLLTTMTIGGIVAMQGLGRVLHRVQAVAIPACLAGFALGIVLLALAQGPVSLGAALLVVGGASGALDISLNMRVARIETDLGVRLFNRVHALFPFSMLVTSAAVGLLREAGATPAVIFPPIAALLLGLAVLEYGAGAHQAAARPHGGGTAARVRLGGVLLILGSLAAMGATMEGGAHTWSAIFVERALGEGPAMAGFASAAITLGLTTGRLLADRIEHRLRDMVILRLCALAAVPAFAILALAPNGTVALAGFFLAGIGIGPFEPAVFRSVSKRYPEERRGRALALATGLAYVGYLSSPPIMGRLIEGFGWPVMWATLAMGAIVASALTTRVPPATSD